ncbi:MarR family transcriptional regulator [Vogesella sp. LIG4]|uniref:MarR family transcriptional regulator n=1 Tax=Vogesella sp. LIG4 TaxID=1192162 RepID=UPI00081F8B09|nr:MarR family transcriptional regulator [Vogesella sp. LIG4]SCK20085.1 MarR family transcriptional regulator, negative regulator of the multidrug operon emrRAB [Vogesella sp. LIG4]
MQENRPACQSFTACEQATDTIARKMPGAPREEVLLTRLLLHIQPFLIGYLNESLKPFDMNETTWMALLVLYARPEQRINPSELSDALAFSRTNATRVVDDLCERGLIQRLSCADDRRKTILVLTEAGQTFIADAMPTQRQNLRKLWQDFSGEEKALLDKLLRKLLAKMED